MTASRAELEKRLSVSERVNRTILENTAGLRRRAEEAERSRDVWRDAWEDALGCVVDLVDGEAPVDREALRALLDRWEREAKQSAAPVDRGGRRGGGAPG